MALLWAIPIGIVCATLSMFLIERPVAKLKRLDVPALKATVCLIVPGLFAVGLWYVLPRLHPS